MRVESTDDAVSALHAIYSDCRAARATHNTYAYRIMRGEQILEHYEDDGEYGADRRLLNLLQVNGVKNELIVVMVALTSAPAGSITCSKQLGMYLECHDSSPMNNPDMIHLGLMRRMTF